MPSSSSHGLRRLLSSLNLCNPQVDPIMEALRAAKVLLPSLSSPQDTYFCGNTGAASSSFIHGGPVRDILLRKRSKSNPCFCRPEAGGRRKLVRASASKGSSAVESEKQVAERSSQDGSLSNLLKFIDDAKTQEAGKDGGKGASSRTRTGAVRRLSRAEANLLLKAYEKRRAADVLQQPVGQGRQAAGRGTTGGGVVRKGREDWRVTGRAVSLAASRQSKARLRKKALEEKDAKREPTKEEIMKVDQWSGIMLLNFLAALYGTNAVAIKFIEHAAINPPASLACAIKFGAGALAFSPALVNGVDLESKEDQGIVLAGLELATWLMVGIIAQTAGLGGASASGNASLLFAYTVVLVPLLELFTGRRKISKLTWFATLAALSGMAVLKDPGELSLDVVIPKVGDLLGLLSSMAFAAQIFRAEMLCSKYDPLKLTAVQLVFMFLLAAGWEGTQLFNGGNFTQSLATFEQQLPGLPWIPLIYSGLVCGGIAAWIELNGLRNVHASTATLIYTTIPVWGGLMTQVVMGGPNFLNLGEFVASSAFLAAATFFALQTAPEPKSMQRQREQEEKEAAAKKAEEEKEAAALRKEQAAMEDEEKNAQAQKLYGVFTARDDKGVEVLEEAQEAVEKDKENEQVWALWQQPPSNPHQPAGVGSSFRGAGRVGVLAHVSPGRGKSWSKALNEATEQVMGATEALVSEEQKGAGPNPDTLPSAFLQTQLKFPFYATQAQDIMVKAQNVGEGIKATVVGAKGSGAGAAGIKAATGTAATAGATGSGTAAAGAGGAAAAGAQAGAAAGTAGAGGALAAATGGTGVGAAGAGATGAAAAGAGAAGGAATGAAGVGGVAGAAGAGGAATGAAGVGGVAGAAGAGGAAAAGGAGATAGAAGAAGATAGAAGAAGATAGAAGAAGAHVATAAGAAAGVGAAAGGVAGGVAGGAAGTAAGAAAGAAAGTAAGTTVGTTAAAGAAAGVTGSSAAAGAASGAAAAGAAGGGVQSVAAGAAAMGGGVSSIVAAGTGALQTVTSTAEVGAQVAGTTAMQAVTSAASAVPGGQAALSSATSAATAVSSQAGAAMHAAERAVQTVAAPLGPVLSSAVSTAVSVVDHVEASLEGAAVAAVPAVAPVATAAAAAATHAAAAAAQVPLVAAAGTTIANTAAAGAAVAGSAAVTVSASAGAAITAVTAGAMTVGAGAGAVVGVGAGAVSCAVNTGAGAIHSAISQIASTAAAAGGAVATSVTTVSTSIPGLEHVTRVLVPLPTSAPPPYSDPAVGALEAGLDAARSAEAELARAACEAAGELGRSAGVAELGSSLRDAVCGGAGGGGSFEPMLGALGGAASQLQHSFLDSAAELADQVAQQQVPPEGLQAGVLDAAHAAALGLDVSSLADHAGQLVSHAAHAVASLGLMLHHLV